MKKKIIVIALVLAAFLAVAARIYLSNKGQSLEAAAKKVEEIAPKQQVKGDDTKKIYIKKNGLMNKGILKKPIKMRNEPLPKKREPKSCNDD